VWVNGQAAKPNRRVKPADDVVVSRPSGRKQVLKVLALADRHVARAEARTLYEDVTPPPSEQEIEARRFERLYKAAMTPPRAPDKRQRREIRRFTGRD
jgi:ribosome-associated heat shock protein Hsp15